MNIGTRIFLVALRLAIGWHFLFEGIDKVQSHLNGPAEGHPLWTSEAYLRGATGPLAPFFRGQVEDDPDRAALDRLTLPPVKAGERPQLPPVLEKEWQAAFARFVKFYGVGDAKVVQPEVLRAEAVAPLAGFPANIPWHGLAEITRVDLTKAPDKLQLLLAQIDFAHARDETLAWLQGGEREAERAFSQISGKVKEKTPDRIREYREKLRQLREIEAYGLQVFGKDVWKKNLADLKKDVAARRTELLADLNRPLVDTLDFIYKQRLTKDQQAKGALPGPEPTNRLALIDGITMWGITAVGVCLILGLFTRTACVVGAGFLLLFYAAMPALPWLPVNPRAEGHYFFINKNIIEALALLTLATTYTGRWVGFDGLIHALNPWRRLRDEPPRGSNEGRSAADRRPVVVRETPLVPPPDTPRESGVKVQDGPDR
ncbi:MAG: DoxX family protein [Gemmataceae bacterium]|nr:DoxX family protein [Gemmataceae bacterium]